MDYQKFKEEFKWTSEIIDSIIAYNSTYGDLHCIFGIRECS